MTQPQAVISAIESLGGIVPLGKIYQALQNPDCNWATQTPQASIRRIVRHTKGIYVVRKGPITIYCYLAICPSNNNDGNKRCISIDNILQDNV